MVGSNVMLPIFILTLKEISFAFAIACSASAFDVKTSVACSPSIGINLQVINVSSASKTGYSKYETGENDIPTHILIQLADFYHVSIDYLLNQTDNPERNK